MYDIIKGGIQDQDPTVAKSRVFQSIPGFKEWIEQTSLFNTIKRFAGTGLIIEGIPNGLSLQLNGISNIQSAEDLPIELLIEFYLNSPFAELLNKTYAPDDTWDLLEPPKSLKDENK